MALVVILEDGYYGAYRVEYCFEISQNLLVKVGCDRFDEIETAIRKLSLGRWTKTIREQTDTDFCFLRGFPVNDLNQDWRPQGTEFGAATKYKVRKFPLGVSRKKINRLLEKYPEIVPSTPLPDQAA